MNEPNKKPIQTSPESFKPEAPKMMNMLEETQNNMEQQFIKESGLIDFEIVKFGPCRFIGKTVYASNKRGTGEICEYLREHSDWVFNELDALKEYASDDISNIALQHWELYDPKGDGLTMYWKEYVNYQTYELQGFTVGRFMKADTPVPNSMNYIDIFEIYIAKAWWINEMPRDLEQLMSDEIKRRGIYGRGEPAMFTANLFPIPDENGVPVYGKYIPCIKE